MRWITKVILVIMQIYRGEKAFSLPVRDSQYFPPLRSTKDKTHDYPRYPTTGYLTRLNETPIKAPATVAAGQCGRSDSFQCHII